MAQIQQEQPVVYSNAYDDVPKSLKDEFRVSPALANLVVTDMEVVAMTMRMVQQNSSHLIQVIAYVALEDKSEFTPNPQRDSPPHPTMPTIVLVTAPAKLYSNSLEDIATYVYEELWVHRHN